MLKYLLRRIVYSLIVLLLLSFAVFAIVGLPPGGGWLRNEPLYVRYLSWLSRITRGNFGLSSYWGGFVWDLIRERVGFTFIIAFSTLAFTYLTAIPIAIYSATHPYTPLDYVLTFLGYVGMAMPNFILALILMVVLNKVLGFKVGGLVSPQYLRHVWTWEKVGDFLKHLPLPIIVIGASNMAALIRVLRATLLDELEKPYVRSARARGVSEWRLILKYPVRAALNPLVSSLGTLLPSIISGGAVTSIVLGLPTLGPMLVHALLAQDTYVASTILLLMGVMASVGYLASDLILMWLDPRIRFISNDVIISRDVPGIQMDVREILRRLYDWLSSRSTQRMILRSALLLFGLAFFVSAATRAGEVYLEVKNMRKVPLLANDYTVLYESPDADSVYGYTPGLARLESGRLVASIDIGGPGVVDLPGKVRFRRSEGRDWIGKVFTSDDRGKTWIHRADFPFMHARPFVAGDSVYILGQAHDLYIIRSDDGGETWSEPTALTEGQEWHQSACNVHYANGNVYLVMERRVYDVPGWNVNGMAPVLMRAPIDADLTQRESWTFASELVFSDVMEDQVDLVGIPFFDPPTTQGMSPPGWLETNVVQIVDPDHVWYDPSGHTFHLWMRAHTGGTGYAAIAKVVENDDGTMTTQVEEVPSGVRVLYVPCPGGQMRFHIVYDEQTELYWLLSTLAWDSMTRPDRLPPERYNLPNNERQVLALHFSKNMMDWRMAGVVAQGDSPKQARHYASMVIDGDDLFVLSRSGDERAKSAHDGNIITFHAVENFRELVY